MYDQVLSILRGEDTDSELARQVHEAFPHTDHLCNPQGELIWFEGEYSVEKHKAAYERSKKYLPVLKKGKLTWKPHRRRVKFYRLFSPQKMLEFPKKIPKANKPKENTLLIGTVGTYEGKKAVVTQCHHKRYKRNTWVGIGDPECQFKNFGDSKPLKLGPQSQAKEMTTWSVQTLQGTLRIDARKFKATDQVVAMDEVQQALAEKPIVVAKPKAKPVEPLKIRIVQELCPEFNVGYVQNEARRIVEVSRNVNPYKSLRLATPDPPCKNCGHNNYIDARTHFVCTKCACVRTKFHQGLPYRVMENRDINTCGQKMNPLYSEAWHRRTTVIGCEKLDRMQEMMNHDHDDMQIFAAEQTIRDVCSMLQLGDHYANTAHILYCKFRKKHIVEHPHVKMAACLLYSIDKYK